MQKYTVDLYFKCKHLNSQAHIEDLNTASGEFGGSLQKNMETIPSEAAGGNGPAERVTASSPSPNINASKERQTNVFPIERAGWYSLSCGVTRRSPDKKPDDNNNCSPVVPMKLSRL